jgi:hypothetical protein
MAGIIRERAIACKTGPKKKRRTMFKDIVRPEAFRKVSAKMID